MCSAMRVSGWYASATHPSGSQIPYTVTARLPSLTASPCLSRRRPRWRSCGGAVRRAKDVRT
ncbi:unnamed protein product [Polarella glacialis]|uniref:Uncharacterized protein n=1 Tax=Polarella glacialis TaxID=89957 RepID=A0A813KEX2_POLGL|nr:unnamed protein product [Polarella glacialis]